MESTNGGGIVSHLKSIREKTTEWLEYLDKKLGKGKQKDDLLALTIPESMIPDCPEPYGFVVQSRRMELPIWHGGIDNMPYMFRMEIDAALAGEDFYKALLRRNLELKQAEIEERLEALAEQES